MINSKSVCRILGLSLLVLTGLLVIPAVCAHIYSESVMPFLKTMAVSLITGSAFFLIGRKHNRIYAKEGFIIVTLVWIAFALIGALPFYFSRDIPSYLDACFETMSGFTTTGSSILNDVEAMSHGCLFWRSFTHFIGGMGVLVFMMALLPMNEDHSMHIMKAEVPGPTVGKLVPRARDTSKILYIIYSLLTVIETAFLMFGGMSFFDAVLHAFGTAGTGGFSTRNASVAAFNSTYIEMVIASFLVLFGINFNLYYFIAIKKVKLALKSEELHVYLLIIIVCVVLIGVSVGFKDAFFNVASIITTAGFGTADFTKWPQYCQVIIVLLMFCGACAGSTGGGLKVSRVIILFKEAFSDIIRNLYPRRVVRVRIEDKPVEIKTVQSIYAFFFLYISILLFSTFIVSFDGYDFTTSFTASLSCISNIGPGLSLVGPKGNFAIFSPLSKTVLTVTMLVGRLEIYPFIIFLGSLLPGFKKS